MWVNFFAFEFYFRQFCLELFEKNLDRINKLSNKDSSEEEEKPKPVRQPPPSWLLAKREEPKDIFRK